MFCFQKMKSQKFEISVWFFDIPITIYLPNPLLLRINIYTKPLITIM